MFGSWFKAGSRGSTPRTTPRKTTPRSALKTSSEPPETQPETTTEVEVLQDINAALREELALVKERLNEMKMSKRKGSRRTSLSTAMEREVRAQHC